MSHLVHTYSKAVCLFNVYYWSKKGLDFVVVDFDEFCHLNGLAGKIESYIRQFDHYIVTIIPPDGNLSNSSTNNAWLFPQYMQPLHEFSKED
jgi:hypothetical protein